MLKVIQVMFLLKLLLNFVLVELENDDIFFCEIKDLLKVVFICKVMFLKILIDFLWFFSM